jgi:CBS domain-containing protein
MRTLTVQQFMTSEPREVAADMPLVEAQLLMRSLRVRHLPVVRGSAPIGVLSQRDVLLMETLQDASPEASTVDEAMRAEPYLVAPHTPLGEVVQTMWAEKLGCALVVDADGALAGIFTRSDALRALTLLLVPLQRPLSQEQAQEPEPLHGPH